MNDELKLALKELDFAVDDDEFARLKGADIPFGAVPMPTADAAAPIVQFELQVACSVPVGSDLLIANHEYVVKRIAVTQVADKGSRHSDTLLRTNKQS
jgi:hypothetical protein